VTRLARAFVAVVPSDAVLDALDARVRPLAGRAPALRWLPRHQWHLTLAFLGEVDDATVLTHALETATRDVAPFTIELAGAGAFPAPRRASILWVGVGAGASELTTLASVIRDATAGPTGPGDDRPYHPHLTIARAARPRRLADLVETIGPAPIGPACPVTHVALVESDTRPDGAVHTVRERLPLRGA
jgi:2'-5' RNA ligase